MITSQPLTWQIAPDGSGDFCTITEALHALEAFDEMNQTGAGTAPVPASLPRESHLHSHDYRIASPALQPVCFSLRNGIYREQLLIRRPFLTLTGESPAGTVLTGSLFARMPREDIGKLGTFRSFSSLIMAHDVTLRNLTFENAAGKGPDVGQALALYADGDRLLFENCRFLGGQDTLFTAPLPPAEIEPNGFTGPGQKLPRVAGRHCYRDCYIEGDIDFIFGGAAAYFENCEFFSKDTGRAVNSYVTAASTPQGAAYGYVMKSCRFTGNCPPHSAYLGRPWREFAQTVLLDCVIGQHICEEGWHDWNKPQAHETVLFAEYGSTGPSSDMAKRPGWVKQLTPAEAKHYDRRKVLGGTDQWNP